MARAKQLDVITGSIANLSFYTRKGSDTVFVRTKGGAKKNRIKRSPEFENVRKSNKEFGGCSKMSKEIRRTFYALAHVADFNVSSELCAIAKKIQKEDIENPVGERTIRLSAYRQILSGFDFNRSNRFDSILRVPFQWNIERELQQAVVDIPAFNSSFALNMFGNYALFRIIISMGRATDFQLNDRRSDYEATHFNLNLGYGLTSTPWYSTLAAVPEQQLKLDILNDGITFNDDDTLILCIAIEFGALDALANPTTLKHRGAGKILGLK